MIKMSMFYKNKIGYLTGLVFLTAVNCLYAADFPDGESQYRDFAPDGVPFTIVDSAWEVDMLGNHRAVVKVDAEASSGTADAVKVTLPWRRPDMRQETKKIVVIDSKTGEEIKNVSVLYFSSERGIIAFQPQTVPGTYYVYYLPAKFRKGWDDDRYHAEPYSDYLPPVYATHSDWEKEVKNNPGTVPEAQVIRFESRLKFDFFTPMGLIATEKEKYELKQEHTGDYMLFPEDRAYPIRLATIPVRWAKEGPSNKFEGYALPNEYYTWQIGVWASGKSLKNVRLQFSDFKHSSGDVISYGDITCFNTGGTNWDGQPVEFQVDVPQNKVQALWCGIQIPETVREGVYNGTVTFTADGVSPKTVDVTIHTGKEVLADKGDGDLWRHARLRWLNSTIGMDDLPVTPYTNMALSGNKVTATGKTLEIDANGLPKSIEINGRQILNQPMSFVVETGQGTVSFDAKNMKIEKKADGLVQWEASSEQHGLRFKCTACMEFDGYIRYHVHLSANQEITVKDVRLVTSYTPVASEYFMGVGHEGGIRPKNYTWNWKEVKDGFYVLRWDSYWTGGDKAGLHVEFRGANYHGPLLVDYMLAPPRVWENDEKGSISVSGDSRQPATVVASTGEHKLSVQPLDFEFALLITPVRPVNPAKHFSERYYHGDPNGFSKAAEGGANIANVHHGNALNPYINYPFVVREPLIKHIQAQHDANRKIKLYYTVRLLSNYTAEIHALKSLNHEIFITGNGYGVPWLCEHLVDDYCGGWYSELPGNLGDASLVTNSFSRWLNYYLESIRWMFENYDIDGLYLDDVSFDRDIMKRMRKIIAQYRPSALIDLHSFRRYSNGPANQYADFFPYIDRLWFGEDFEYNKMKPDEWFVTFSGIPFGMMSEMLHYTDGGNPYLGMVYGATNRSNVGTISPAPVWKLWKDFGIEEAQMIGYWDETCPVKTDHPDVKATVYVRPGKTLVAIGNFGAQDQTIRLTIDWKALGLDPSKATIEAPQVENFQQFQTFDNIYIPVKSKEGWLLIIQSDNNEVTGNSEFTPPNPLRAWVCNGMVHITGITVGQALSLNNVAGALIYHGIAASDKVDIPLSAQGMYVVRSANHTTSVVYN